MVYKFAFGILISLTLHSCKTKHSPDLKNNLSQSQSAKEKDNQSIPSINSIRLYTSLDTPVASIYTYEKASLGIRTGIAESVANMMGLGPTLKYYFPDAEDSVGAYRKKRGVDTPDQGHRPAKRRRIEDRNMDIEEAEAPIRRSDDVKVLSSSIENNSSKDDFLVLIEGDQKPEIPNSYLQKVSTYNGVTQYRGFAKINQSLAELRGNENRVLSYEQIKSLNVTNPQSRIFADLIKNAPDGIVFNKFTLGGYYFEKTRRRGWELHCKKNRSFRR